MIRVFLPLLILSFFSFNLLAQDPLRFEEEVAKFKNTADQYPEENRIVFTGSSSIRLWVDFEEYFPEHNAINTGFGGSETSDLIYYKDLLIDQFKPKQVFIYEGDNDINSGKSSIEVLRDMSILVQQLIEDGIENIVIISPKPSITRWGLKKEYESLNRALGELARLSPKVHFADVWSPMLTGKVSLKQDIFIEDGLHMNKKGYDLWIKVIESYLIEP